MSNNLEVTTDQEIQRVLSYFKMSNPVLLGRGDEGIVYERGNDALKIYRRKPNLEYLHNLQDFQINYLKGNFTFDTPEINEIGETDGVVYTIEKRLSGTQMDTKIVDLPTADRQKIYLSYYDAIRQVHRIHFPDLPYGEIIKTPRYIAADSWNEFLIAKLDQKIAGTREKISPHVADFDKKLMR